MIHVLYLYMSFYLRYSSVFIQQKFENSLIETRILFSGIDKKRDLIYLFWDPIQWISCLKQ